MDHLPSPLASSSAPGKAILLGEHAAVYGRSAIAIPVGSVQSLAEVYIGAGPLTIDAPDLGAQFTLEEARGTSAEPLAAAVAAALRHAERPAPEWRVVVTSTVPMGSGMGSSASVAVATVRAVAEACGIDLAPAEAASLATEAEQVAHGRASGIDPTVVALDRPILFRAGQSTPLTVRHPLNILVADSAEKSNTAAMVEQVARARDHEPRTYDGWFDQMQRLTDQAVRVLANGDYVTLGRTLNQYHLVLQAMRLSSAGLEALIAAARDGGALGAKLTGAGGGGSVVALPRDGDVGVVERALFGAGARQVYTARIAATAALA